MGSSRSRLDLQRARRRSGVEDRGDNVLVAGAATDVAFEFFTDSGRVELAVVPPDHVEGTHDHPRRAVATLQAMMLAKGRLQRVEFIASGESLDGENAGAVRLRCQHRAGFYRQAVDVNDAGAALGRVATDVRARQTEFVAQKLNEE